MADRAGAVRLIRRHPRLVALVEREHLGDHSLDEAAVDDAAVGGIGAEHGVVADGVDEAGQALRVPVNHLHGGVVKDVGFAGACHAQPVPDVPLALLQIQGGKVKGAEEPLAQLPHIAGLEDAAEFGLADDKGLQQLGVVVFEIAEHAQLFEPFGGQGLGLVDQEHDRRVMRVVGDEEVLQRPGAVRGAGVAGHRNAELVAHGGEQVTHRAQGMVDRGGANAVPEMVQHHLGQQRLARPHFARQQHEALAFADRVDHRSERLLVIRRGEEETRIGGVVEGQFR